MSEIKLESAQSTQDVVSTTLDSEQPASKTVSRRRLRFILIAALAIPVFIETLDYTVVATAQPTIASAFNRLDLQSYIGTVYLLTSTVFLPLFASLADVYGRHWAMQASLLMFLFGSAISTGAQNMIMMLAGRSIAGIGAAGLLTVVRVILADSASLDDNNWQASILFLLYTPGFSAGPAIGGALTSVSFRWVFAINLPCCVVSMVIIFFLLRKTTKGAQPPRRLADTEVPANQTQLEKLQQVDWLAAALFVTGGILVLLALNWGSTDAWASARVIVCLVLGALLFAACFVWEYALERGQRAAAPSAWFAADTMIPLDVLRSYDVCATQLMSFASGMVMLVVFYFVAIFMTIVTGLSAVQAGVQLIYFAPGMAGGSIIAIRMIRRLRQPKYPIILGGTVIPVALGLISWAMQKNNQSEVNGFMAMAGVGCGLTFGPILVHARFSQPDNRVSIIVALNLFTRSLGGTVGLAQCATVLNAKVRAALARAAAAGVLDGVPPTALAAASLSSLQDIAALPPAVQTAVRAAFRDGVRWCFVSLVPWAVLALLACLFLTDIRDTDRLPGGPRGSRPRGTEGEKAGDDEAGEDQKV